MNNTPQEPWLSREVEEGMPFIGNRKGFELLKDAIEKLLVSEDGTVPIECESFGFSELKIQERLSEEEEAGPLSWGCKLFFYVFLAVLVVIISMILFLAITGFNHLIS